jgi:hypothetical protein
MHEYYDVIFPVAVLLASSLHHGSDFIILGVHLLVFPRGALVTVVDLWRMQLTARAVTRRFVQRTRLQISHKR